MPPPACLPKSLSSRIWSSAMSTRNRRGPVAGVTREGEGEAGEESEREESAEEAARTALEELR